MSFFYKGFTLIWVFIAIYLYMEVSSYLSPKVGRGWGYFWGISASFIFVLITLIIIARVKEKNKNKP